MDDDPDGSGYCYIGFEGRDPDLHQVWEQGSFDGTFRYKHWVQYLYYRISKGYTVNDALDWATQQMGGSYQYFSQRIFIMATTMVMIHDRGQKHTPMGASRSNASHRRWKYLSCLKGEMK